ncbi:MAG: MptD family putative ECF transporter S component [Peptococcaceae bacterium]|jgi:energy-coupling factor transport system substrate-specific component|nr:MptD family putative ECF transporter S component [Peptococcaceae bacterium]
MNTNKLKAKDLITIAIFTVVFSLILFVISMTIGMIPVAYPFLMAAASVPGGIVWAYMRVKVPKRFTILIQCVVMALLFLILGVGWFGAVGLLAGGVLAEFITSAGGYRRFSMNTVGYAVVAFCIHCGMFLIMLLARDYYYDYCVSNGMTVEWTEIILNFMSWPVMLLTGVLAIVGAVIGMLLGRAFLKKHFVKAGII